VIVPIEAVHVTASLVVEPCTAAVNWTLAPSAIEAAAGETVTEVTSGLAVEPFPCRDSTTGRCGGSATSVMLPSTLPTAAAANFTVKLLLCPTGSVIGVVKPVTVKPVPLTTAWLTRTSVVPTFVTLTTCELVAPTLALTERVLGLIVRDGSGSATPAHPETQKIVANATHINSTRTCLFGSEFI
jgi:hypothetical protein